MKFLVLCLFISLSIFAQNPDEWPVMHNVHHTGLASGTQLKPPLKLKWAAKVPGCFKAGPVIAEGKMVVQGRDGYLFCFDAETGDLVWRYFVQRVQAHYVGYLETGPCIWNGRVYAAFHSAGHPGVTGMRCLDLNTGRLQWKRDVGWTEHRIHYSPQVSNGRLFFCSNRDLTGKQTETLSELNYVAQVQAWDAVTGDTLWTYNMWTGECQNTTLLVVGDTVIASVGEASGNTNGKTVVFDLDGNVLWQSTTHHVSGYTGNMQYHDNKLILLTAGRNGVTILDMSDWSVVLQGGSGDCYSKISPIMNGKYFNRGYGGYAHPYSLTTGQSLPFTSKWSHGAKSGCSAPVAGNGYIFNGFGNPNINNDVNNGHQFVSTDEAGNIVWFFQDVSNHCASLAIAYDKLYGVAGTEGMVYCFENDN